MKVEGEHIFKGPREVVYEMFNDPKALGNSCSRHAEN